MWSAGWSAAWTGAPDRRRTPEALRKDGCPAQNTGCSINSQKHRPCLAALAATLQATDALSEAITFVPGDVRRGLPEGVLALTSRRLTCGPSTPTRLADEGERSQSSHFIVSLRISHLVPRAHSFV